MSINSELKKYIESEILPRYELNDKGHGIAHVMYVIERSLKFAQTVEGINLDMVYVIASYHDVGHSIDAANHEVISAQILSNDENLQKFFSDDEIKTMIEAVEDHRASLEHEPRSIYGKIVSSADRSTDIDQAFQRTYQYRLIKMPNASLKQILDDSYEHLTNKFGCMGYATEKIYFDDAEYKKYLDTMAMLLDDREAFNRKYIEVNNINVTKELSR